MTATFTEWRDMYVREIKYLETIYQAASTVTDDLLTQDDAIVQGYEGSPQSVSEEASALLGVRSDVSSALSDSARSLMEARFLSVRKIINSNADSVEEVQEDLYDYMVENGHWFESRVFSRGSWTAGGSNTGDGEAIRCLVDAQAMPIENTNSEVITATCVANAAGFKGSRGKTDPGSEIFEVKGLPSGEDALDVEVSGLGSGLTQDFTCKRSGDSLVNNPSWSDFEGTAATPTSINDWTVTTDIGNFEIDQTNYYVEDESENGTPGSLKITATDTITQLLSVTGNQFNSDAPYLCQLKFNRAVGSAAGTLELHLGSQSVSVTVSAQSGWNTLRLALDENCWFENFDADELTSVKVVWTHSSGTGILVDDLRLVQFETFDNLPTLFLGGATRWRIGDTGTFTDTETGKINQRWNWRLFDWNGPSVPAATQITASGGRTLTFNDNGGSADTITASSGSFITDGYKVGMTLTVASSSSNDGTYTLTAVAATTLTVATGSLANEGPLSATTTLDAKADILDPSVTF